MGGGARSFVQRALPLRALDAKVPIVAAVVAPPPLVVPPGRVRPPWVVGADDRHRCAQSAPSRSATRAGRAARPHVLPESGPRPETPRSACGDFNDKGATRARALVGTIWDA